MKKEKILINIEKLFDIEEYKKIGINNFLFAVDYFSIGYNSFKLDELKDLDCKKYLLINRIFNNDDVEKFKNIKEELKSFDGIIFEDIAVYNILKNSSINLIWNQTHFATNYSSINYWLNNLYSVVLSNEITKEEVSDILERVNKPVIVNVFGKNIVMYSRRKLLTNFNEHFKIENVNSVLLNESITNNKFDTFESEFGTLLFSDYFNIINYLKYFNNDNILYYLIYPKGLSIDVINNVINGDNVNKYNDGFMNKKTIYKLGEK
ncbi:MAG: U32 family peptidase [Bacilli bacterium]|nr:U32 family peptidase [Bacilli bacterium]